MNKIIYDIVKYIFGTIFKIIYMPKVIGKENIPSDGAVVLAGNHTNNLDAAIIISSPKRRINTLSKIELFSNKISNFFFTSMGCIKVDRKNHNDSATKESINILNNNGVIALFPEGTYHKKKNTLLPFKYGAVSLASKTNATLVPFVIKGEYKPFRRSVSIKFLKGYKVSNNLENENIKLESIIREELENE